jgi:hypothetical protein
MKAVEILRSFTLTFLTTVIALLFLMRASPAAAAGNCVQDVFGKKLQCTANDVSLSGVVPGSVRDTTGKAMPTCFSGTTFSFIADFQVVTTSTARENIGFYLGTGTGATQVGALKGTCTDQIVSPLHTPGANTVTTTGGEAGCNQNGGTQLCLGSALYHEFDTSLPGDNCGDTTSADGTSQIVTFEVDNVTCPSTGSTLSLPDCTSWQQPGGAILCESSPPNTGWPWVKAADPGTTSKCSCGVLNVPITAISYAMTATKTPTPSSLPEPGGDFSYVVGVTNTTTTTGAFGSEIINQLCDNKYGNIATTGACSGGTNNGNACTTNANCPSGTCVLPPACPAGGQCTGANAVAGGTCAIGIKCSLPQTVASGATVTNLCSFTGAFSPGSEGSLTDIVTVNGFGNTGGTSPPAVTAANSATVTVSEATPAAKVIKSLDNGRGCATVRYKVEVDNTSGATTDESESLTVLNDNPGFGDITKLSSSVLGTTCGVATTSAGLGTLNGTTGAGTLPAPIAVGGNYTCEFDGQFCGALATDGTCAHGLTHSNTMTATLKGDEIEDVVTQDVSMSSLTAHVCFTSTSP